LGLQGCESLDCGLLGCDIGGTSVSDDVITQKTTIQVPMYEGESNENRKTEIKIRNIALLSYKLADMLTML
jgi:hypothetical protein